MKLHSPIIIEQARNGFIVRPYCADNRMYSTNDIFVFNAMRHAPEAYEYAKRGSSLLTFVGIVIGLVLGELYNEWRNSKP